jgi:hypothetical protein
VRIIDAPAETFGLLILFSRGKGGRSGGRGEKKDKEKKVGGKEGREMEGRKLYIENPCNSEALSIPYS